MRLTLLALASVALCACAQQPAVVHRASKPAVVKRPVATYAPINLRGLSDAQVDALQIELLREMDADIRDSDADIRANRAQRQAEESSEALRQTIEEQGEAIERAIRTSSHW